MLELKPWSVLGLMMLSGSVLKKPLDICSKPLSCLVSVRGFSPAIASSVLAVDEEEEEGWLGKVS